MFKTVRVLVVLTAAIGIALTLVALRPKAERQEIPETGRLVEVFDARPQRLTMTVETFGTVQAREALNLVAEVRGQIVALSPAFAEGAAVKSGEVLITIDPRTYALEVEACEVLLRQAKAEVEKLEQEVRNLRATRKLAQSEASLAKAEVDRLSILSKRKVISQTTLEKAEQQYLAAQERLQAIDNQIALTGPSKAQLTAQRDMADVRRRQAQLDLERTRIQAPFDAWVLEKAVETGQHTTVGQYLGRIYRRGALDVEVRLTPDDLKWLPADFSAGVMPEVTITTAGAARERAWRGKVARVLARVDEKTRTLPLIVEVEDLEPSAVGETGTGTDPVGSRLRPGMFVAVHVTGRRLEGVFMLPRHVVRDDGTVYVAQNGRLKIQPVNVLRRFKDAVYVDQGLSEGDLVISSPLSGAVEGMALRTKQIGQPPSGS